MFAFIYLLLFVIATLHNFATDVPATQANYLASFVPLYSELSDNHARLSVIRYNITYLSSWIV